MVYISILCAINLIYTTVAALQLQVAFIDNRNYPDGGPIGYLGSHNLPVNIANASSYILSQIFGDGLLVWRCWIIFTACGGSLSGFVALFFPMLIYLASVVWGIIFNIESFTPSGPFTSLVAHIGFIYFVISLSLNIILTIMIAGRIFIYQRQYRDVLGREHGSQYTSLMAILIESSAMYTVVSLLVLITYAVLNNPINQVWLGIAPAVQAISNYLIIYRVAEGKAWSRGTTSLKSRATGSTLVFAPNSHSTRPSHYLTTNPSIPTDFAFSQTDATRTVAKSQDSFSDKMESSGTVA